MSDQNGSKPLFNFTTTSLRDSNRMDVLNLTVQKAQRDLEIEAMEAAQVEIMGLICKVVVFVPQDWLVDEAPDGLSFDDTDDLLWLQTGKFSELVTAIAEARDSGKKK